MTTLGQAYVQIIPSAQGISGSISNVLNGEAGAAGDSAGSLLGGNLVKAISGIVAAAGIGKMFSESLMAGADLQQSVGGIETLFKDSADKVKQYAQEAYKTSGVSANAYMENVTSFSASLISSLGGDTKAAADLANTAMTDMSDNANKMGTDIESVQQTYQSLARGNYAMLDNLKLGYGGTKSEMERLMKDAEKLTGEHYTVGDFADTVKAIHAVQDSLGITGTTAKEAATTFSGSLASMKAAFTDVLGNLSSGEFDIGPSLNALAETTSTFFFGNFIPMVGRIITGLPGALVTFFNAAKDQIIPEIQKLFSADNLKIDFAGASIDVSSILSRLQPVNTGIQTAFGQLPALFSTIASSVAPVIDTITTGFSKMNFSGIQVLISSIIPALQAGFNSFMTIAGPAIDKVVQSFTKLWNTAQPLIAIIASALAPAFQVLGSYLGGVFNGIMTSLSTTFDLLSSVIQFLTPVFKVLVDAFTACQPVISAIASGVGFIIGSFTNLSAVSEGLGSIMSSAWSNISNAIKTAASLIDSAISWIKTAFSGVGSAGEAVKNILSLAWMAIGDVIKTVKNVISGAMSAAINAFNSFSSVVSNVGKSVKNVIDGIKKVFDSLRNIDLSGAGSAIMNGFLGGLKSSYENVKSFVSGIAGWIKDHKGPIEYDRVLLRPAGQAIMGGLNNSLTDGFKDVQGTVKGMAGAILSDFGTPQLESSISTVVRRVGDNGLSGQSVTVSQSDTMSHLELIINLLEVLVEKDTDLYLDSDTLISKTYRKYKAKLDAEEARKRRLEGG